MKAVILAGGKGTRLQDGTSEMPKPLVEAGGKPLISPPSQPNRRSHRGCRYRE